MQSSQLVSASELRRLLRRKTLFEDEVRSLKRKEVLCECGNRMPALRCLLAGYDTCPACYEPAVYPVLVGGGRVEVGSEGFLVSDV